MTRIEQWKLKLKRVQSEIRVTQRMVNMAQRRLTRFQAQADALEKKLGNV